MHLMPSTHAGRCSHRLLLPTLILSLVVFGCGDDDDSAMDTGATADTGSDAVGEDTADVSDTGADTGGSGECDPGAPGTRPALFLDGSLASGVTEEPCMLTNGEEVMCYRIEIVGEPTNHETGPYCPRTIDDGPEDVGLWPESGTLYDVDGAFVTNLATFYDDPTWQLYNPDTGEVNVTDTAESCLAAAMPDAPEEYANFCVECTLEDVGGPSVIEYLIPIVPVPRDGAPGEIGNTPPGVSLNGVRIEFPADTDIILGAYNIAPLDDCGGHVNNGIGYHYHESTGCADALEQCDGHAPLIGFAQDGYPIYAMTGEDRVEPSDLDACRGHTDDVRGYHYHAASPGENMFIGCFSGEIVDAGGGRPPRR